jgi:tetratricopeptide (TPR) repeat protein
MRRYAFRSVLGPVFSLCLSSGTAVLAQGVAEPDMAQRATESLRAARTLDVPKSEEVTTLILQERFAEFERRSKIYEARFAQDPVYESPLIKLYDALERGNNKVLEELDKWVGSRPSYISYGARGVWKQRRGYWLRGGEFVERTPPESFASMRRLHEQARRDLSIALEMNAKFAPAYNSLIRIERASGSRKSAKMILATAVRQIPQTYYVRFEYLQALTPRWGGSYKRMQIYTDDLDKKAVANPRIWSLKGEAFADRGVNAWNASDYEAAVRHYTTALSYGDRMEFLKDRGYVYMGLGQNDLALADLVRYRQYDRNNAEVNQYISRLTSTRVRASR